MKKSLIIRIILTPLVFLGMHFMPVNESWAAAKGEQVQTNAGIFLRETDSSAQTTAESTDDQLRVKTKPKGKLPSTGDLIKTSILFSGLVLSIAVLCLFFWKKRVREGVDQ